MALPFTDILRLYADEAYRKRVARAIRNETVRHFWRYEFESYHFRMRGMPWLRYKTSSGRFCPIQRSIVSGWLPWLAEQALWRDDAALLGSSS